MIKHLQKSVLFGFILFFVCTGIGAAQTQKTKQPQSLQVQGLAITPFIIETTVAPGKTTTEKIVLDNTTNETLTYDLSINDFAPDKVTGQPKFLLTGETANPKYSLSSWISVTTQPSFTLAPNGHTEVAFTIAPPEDAEPGTHYGGILFATKPGLVSKSGPSVTEKAGTIILVKIGTANEQGAITKFYNESVVGSDTTERFAVTFHNFGNVHLKPKGEIYIKNMFGKVVGNVYVNRDATIILPENEREYETFWTKSRFAFGRYTAESIMYFGNPKIEVREKIAFWILPWKTIVGLIVLILLLFIVIRAYNKWLIKRSLH
jgi:hypothetical protein